LPELKFSAKNYIKEIVVQRERYNYNPLTLGKEKIIIYLSYSL